MVVPAGFGNAGARAGSSLPSLQGVEGAALLVGCLWVCWGSLGALGVGWDQGSGSCLLQLSLLKFQLPWSQGAELGSSCGEAYPQKTILPVVYPHNPILVLAGFISHNPILAVVYPHKTILILAGFISHNPILAVAVIYSHKIILVLAGFISINPPWFWQGYSHNPILAVVYSHNPILAVVGLFP